VTEKMTPYYFNIDSDRKLFSQAGGTSSPWLLDVLPVSCCRCGNLYKLVALCLRFV